MFPLLRPRLSSLLLQINFLGFYPTLPLNKSYLKIYQKLFRSKKRHKNHLPKSQQSVSIWNFDSLPKLGSSSKAKNLPTPPSGFSSIPSAFLHHPLQRQNPVESRRYTLFTDNEPKNPTETKTNNKNPQENPTMSLFVHDNKISHQREADQ